MTPCTTFWNQGRARAIGPLVYELASISQDGDAVLDAWIGVCQFLDDAGLETAFAADLEALILAKVLLESGRSRDASRLCSRIPSLESFAGTLPLDRMSLSGLFAISAGIMRGVEQTALCDGACVVLDGEPFRAKREFLLDLTALPTLRMLMDDALEILNAVGRPGVLILKGWTLRRGDCGRRNFAEAVFERLSPEGSRHRLIWIEA